MPDEIGEGALLDNEGISLVDREKLKERLQVSLGKAESLISVFHQLVDSSAGLSQTELREKMSYKATDSALRHLCRRLGALVSSFSGDITNESGQRLRYTYHDAQTNNGRYALKLEVDPLGSLKESEPVHTQNHVPAVSNESAAPLRPPAESFWSAHISGDFSKYGISIFVSTPTFFRLRKDKKVFRYMDINVGPDGEREVLRLLREKSASGKESKAVTADIYLLRGEVEARDVLGCWFYEESNFPRHEKKGAVVVKKKNCSRAEMEDDRFVGRSSVLLGSPRTSSLTRDVLDQNKRLPFTVDQRGLIRISLNAISDTAAITSLKHAIGIPRPAAKQSIVLRDKVPNGQVYTVVTRVPHPQSRHTHVVTLISCDSTRALKRIAQMLTSDAELALLAEKASWSNGWPRSFQMLFGVELEEDNLKGTPDLIAWWGTPN